MEFLNLLMILATASILWRRPDRERAASMLLLASIVLMVFLFSWAARSSLLPGVNY